MTRSRRPARAVARVLLVLSATGVAGCAPGPLDPMARLAPAEALPEPTGSWIELGRKLLAADQPVQAEAAFIRAIRVEGLTAAALTGAGVAAHRQGLLTEARRYFERAKKLDPDSVAAHNNLGAALYGLGELHAARHAFRTAFALSSGTSREAERNLGMADLAIARAEAADPPLLANPRAVRRTGSSVYQLIVQSGAAERG